MKYLILATMVTSSNKRAIGVYRDVLGFELMKAAFL